MLTNDKIIKELENDSSYYGNYGKQFLSNSDIDDLLNNPKNFKKGKDKTVPMLIGSYFHTSILEPHKLPDFEIVDASTRNTNIYKDARGDRDMLLLRSEANEIDELVSVMKGNLTMYENIYKEGNQYEVPAVKEIYGTMWKGKADIITDEYLIDIKTTSKIDDFRWSARKYNYDSQAWIYQQLFEKPLIFYVIDKSTKMLGIFVPGEDFLEQGRIKVLSAIEVWRKFYSPDAWEDINNYIIEEEL